MKMTRRMRNVTIGLLLVFTIILAGCDYDSGDMICGAWDDSGDCLLKASPFVQAVPQDNVAEGTVFKVLWTAKLGDQACEDPSLYEDYASDFNTIAEADWRFEFSSPGVEWMPLQGSDVECTAGTCILEMSMDTALSYYGASVPDDEEEEDESSASVTYDDFCVSGVVFEMDVIAPNVDVATPADMTFVLDLEEMQDEFMPLVNSVYEDKCEEFINDEYTGRLASGNSIDDCWYNTGYKKVKPYLKCYREHFCKGKCKGTKPEDCPNGESEGKEHDYEWQGPTTITMVEEGITDENGVFPVTITPVHVSAQFPEGPEQNNQETPVAHASQGRAFSVPVHIQAEDIETDLARLHLFVTYPQDSLLLEAPSNLQLEESEGLDLSFAIPDDFGTYCAEFPSLCDFEGLYPDEPVQFARELYSVDMARLFSDGSPTDHLEVTLDTYVDFTFIVTQFLSGEVPVIVVPGISSTVEDSGILWLHESAIDLNSKASEFDARCAVGQDDDGLLEMYVGQEHTFKWTMQKPAGTQGWANDFRLIINNHNELTNFPDAWEIAVSKLVQELEEPPVFVVEEDNDVTFDFEVKAPLQPGLFSISYQMMDADSQVFGEKCEIPVFVTDRVVPGWSIAYSDNGFAGYDVAGVRTIEGGDGIIVQRTEDGKGGVVSDVITIPDEGAGNYQASVTLSEACGNLPGTGAEIQIINANNANPIPGTTEFISEDGANRKVFTPNAPFQAGESYRLLMFSNFEPDAEDYEGIDCVTLTNVALINTDEVEELNPDIHFSPTTSPAGCCPEGFCWQDNECVSVESTDDVTKPLACDADGVWTIKVEKQDFYGENKGYCLDDTMCYYHGDNGQEQRCVSSGEYFGDQYCADGNWTTRTAVVAAQLLSMAQGAQDYALYCGQPGEALHFMEYLPSINAGTMVKDALQCGSVDGGDNTCAHLNNVCVLEYMQAGQLRTTFGLSMNTDIGATLNAGGILPALGEEKEACETGGAINDDNDYDLCATNELDFYFDNDTHTAIVQPQTYGGLTSINTETEVTKESGAFDVFLATDAIWDRLQYLSRNYEDDDNSEEFYNFIENFRHFNNFYMADWNGKQVFGIQEEYTNVQPFGEDDEMKTRTSYTGVYYDGFGSEFCPALRILPETYTDGVLPPQVCEHPDFGCCFSSDRTNLLQSDQFATYGDAIAPQQLSQGIFRYFPDLTIKLRVQ